MIKKLRQLNNASKKKIVSIILAILTLTGAFNVSSKAIKNYNYIKKFNNVTTIESKKLLTKDAVVESLISQLKISVQFAETRKETIIKDEHWYGSKQKTIVFHLFTHFYLNLTNLKDKDVYFTDDKVIINVRPIEVETSFNELMTEFGDTAKKGLLFSDLKMTFEELEKIKSTIKSEVDEQMKGLISGAETKAQEEVEKLIKNITSEQIKVEINFIK